MGRETKTFRQTKRSGSADFGAKSYSGINRSGVWRNVRNIFRKGDKYGKS